MPPTMSEVELLAAEQTRRENRAKVRASQQRYVQTLIDANELTLRQLAIRAQVGPTTLSRFMNDAEYDGLLSSDVLARLAHAYGQRWEIEDKQAAREIDPINIAISYIKGLADNLHIFDVLRVPDYLMAGRGLMKGDFIIWRKANNAPAGSIVIAQVEPRNGRPRETLARLYLPPMLVTVPGLAPAGSEDLLRPLIVDSDHVRIIGTHVSMFRADHADEIIFD